MGNTLEAGIPRELAKLQSLKKLNLNGNPEASYPPGQGGLNALEELNLGKSILELYLLPRFSIVGPQAHE